MKKCLLLLFHFAAKKIGMTLCVTLCIMHCAFSQGGEWTWISGSNIQGNPGVYGTQGIPSVSNHPPGAYEYIDWKDLQGNFWLYGGAYPSLNDLWKYNPVTNEWTWVKGSQLPGQAPVYGTLGVPDPANTPGERGFGSVTWVDTTGNLWLFGGNFTNNDLWKYDISTNEWTWINGSNTTNAPGVHGTLGISSPLNVPGARRENASGWTDSLNNLWLFGGYGYDDASGFGLLNDLMKYNISTNEWTWVSGSNLANDPGNYGIKGVSSPANLPGGRFTHIKWKDKDGNYWIFGGGYPSQFNDVWKYDLSINEWTWMAGTNLMDHTGSYIGYCMDDTLNFPMCRYEPRSSTTDNCGRFWLFGGFTNPIQSTLNDLWIFDPLELKWNWLSGSNITNQPGNYGSLGISSPTNMPPSRAGGDAWWGNDNRFYMFGGLPATGTSCYGDLWVFTPDTNCVSPCPTALTAAFSAPNHICPGTCTDFVNLSAGASSYQWIFPGGNPSVSSDVNPSGICYNSPGNYNVTLIASNGITSDTLTLTNYIIVYPSPPPQGILQSGDTLFANPGATSYQWYYNGNIIAGATDYFYVATQSGDYNVVATDENDCEVEAVINNVVASSQFPVSSSRFVIIPNPVSDKFTIHDAQFTIGTANAEISIYNLFGEKIPLAVNCCPWIVDCRSLSPGMYYIEINSNNKIFRSKFMKQ